MQSETNSNVYQIFVREMNRKRLLRFFFSCFFFFFGGGGGWGEGRGLFIIRDHDFLGGILVLCIFISVPSVFINATCIQDQ